MAKAFARGRPIAPLVLSAQEGSDRSGKCVATVLPDRRLSAVASFCDVQTDRPASPSPLSLASMNTRLASGVDAF